MKTLIKERIFMKNALILTLASLIVQSAALAASTQEIVCKTASGYTLIAKLEVNTPEQDLQIEGSGGVVTLRDKGGKVVVKENIKVALQATFDEKADIHSLMIEDLSEYGYSWAGLTIPTSAYAQENPKFIGKLNYAAEPFEGNPVPSFDDEAVCSSKLLK
jgi:hypothetical protein